MSKNPTDHYLPKHSESQPGAVATLSTDAEGDLTVSFSDGSDDLHMSRRDFMRLSGVAAATAAMSGAACRNPIQEVVPYVDRPEDIRIGMNTLYASVCTACPAQCGMLVKTRAGRPFKLEGNPSHPVSQGALCARGQAHYIDLYDPDRARTPLRRVGERTEEITWETLDNEVRNKLREVRAGGGLRILTGATVGSARTALFNEIIGAFTNARHYVYEPLTDENLLTASAAAFGEPQHPHYHFERADVIVSLGSDFLGTWLSPVEFTKQFASRRNPDENMSHFVAFEGNLSLTGINADVRYRVSPNDMVYVALALANEVILVRNQRAAGTGAAQAALAQFTAEAVAERLGGDITADVLRATAQRLAAAPGRSIVVAGGAASATENGVALESAINLLNAALGNDGQTIDRAAFSHQGGGRLADLRALVAEINAGTVNMLIIDGTNPVYSAPPELGVAEAFRKVALVVSTSQRVDETTAVAHYLATGTHGLEAWGDSSPQRGVYAIQQPVIQPLFYSRAMEESLLIWFGTDRLVARFQSFLTEAPVPPGPRSGNPLPHDPGAWYRYLRNHWESTVFPQADSLASFGEFWSTALRNGVFVAATGAQAPNFRASGAIGLLPTAFAETQAAAPGDLSRKKLHLFTSVAMYDGRHANNGHLQELPDTVTRHTWGSYAAVSYKTFNEAGLKSGQIVRIRPAGSDVELSFPILMLPGLHDDVVAIPVGYGRTRVGVVGNEVGSNAFRFSRAGTSAAVLSGIDAAITPTRSVERLSVLKGAGVLDLQARNILPTATLAQYREDPTAGVYQSPVTESLWPSHDYGQLKWGMSIDTSKCTGCSACVIACQEENNIPVVGRQGILEGREMFWLRIDRYYSLPDEAHEARGLLNDPMYHADPQVGFGQYLERPRVLLQPMLCQHCDNAPCETVCPVLATMHSSDGLNQMAYNRCVGTRYCANNCPYKVRRYNWFNYSVDRSDSVFARLYPELKEHGRLNQVEPLTLSLNPDVTVRTRGVMEKCTFCVQRIRRGKWQLMKEGRRTFRNKEVVTACQQACPADAIDFGNMLDETHSVTQHHHAKRAMFVLNELNTRPAIAYLTNVWNTGEDNV
ncbi:MAG: 4Fe-4S dicluster domain-containing protein [Bradymonadaceae bacterium]|nr:4Fe-4S dicluster domain-containing protein [Lujinxingiaceae bacterium]